MSNVNNDPRLAAVNAVAAMLNNIIKISGDRLDYLSARWNDEKEYEDFAAYVVEMKKLIPSAMSFVRATKRPFGFVVQHPDARGLEFAIVVTARAITWKPKRA